VLEFLETMATRTPVMPIGNGLRKTEDPGERLPTDVAVHGSILKDLSDLALHKERREEFMRRVQTILEKYPRLSGLQSRIKNAKLFEGLESK
jgi:hypothetical protein